MRRREKKNKQSNFMEDAKASIGGRRGVRKGVVKNKIIEVYYLSIQKVTFTPPTIFYNLSW